MKENTTHFTRAGDVMEQLSWRYGTKQFDPSRRISSEDWSVLEEALRLSPSSFGLQPWRFIVVENKEVREQLASAAPLNRAKLVSASHIVVLSRLRRVTSSYLERHLDRLARMRNTPAEEIERFRRIIIGKLGNMSDDQQSEWTARQVYVALGVILATAAQLRVDACAMEGIDALAFDRILGLEGSDYSTAVAIAAGYRSPADPTQFYSKVRFDSADVVARH